MALTVVARRDEIVAAINDFDAEYHHGYRAVRLLAAPFLQCQIDEYAASLAEALSEVLCRWGAGIRNAPSVRCQAAVQATLRNLRPSLAWFAAMPITDLSIAEPGRRRVIEGVNAAAGLPGFDERLIALLQDLSDGLFNGNTNVTYPMKALLLVTGFMPALDSQVRTGLHRAGFVGTKGTRFLMPGDADCPRAVKLTRLPFYLAECHAMNADLLTEAAIASNYPWLAAEPGRLFDVLLFMQGDAGRRLLALEPRNQRWYDLL